MFYNVFEVTTRDGDKVRTEEFCGRDRQDVQDFMDRLFGHLTVLSIKPVERRADTSLM